MKKRVALLMSILVMSSSLVGCTTEQKSYLEETEKMAKWESSESEITGKMVMKMPITPELKEGEKQIPELKYETINVDIKAEGYTLNENDGKSIKAYVKMDMKSNEEKLNIKDIKIYVDKDSVYISRNYLDAVMKASGQPVPEQLKKITQEYIVLKTNTDTNSMTKEEIEANKKTSAMNEYMESLTSPEKRKEVIEKATKIMNLLDLNIPVSKSGRTYTTNLKSDQIIDMSVKSIDKAVVNAEEILKIINLTPELKVSKEDVANFKKEYQEKGKNEIFQAMAVAKETIKGSEINTKETFSDNAYKSETNMKLIMKDIMNLDLSMIQKAKQTEKMEIKLPEIKNTISIEKYMEAAIPMEAVDTQAVASETVSTKTSEVVKVKVVK